MVGLDQPHVAISKISQQFLVIFFTHVPRPNYLRGVDVGRIVNPLMVEVVGLAISNHNQVLSWRMLKGFEHIGPRKIAARPWLLNLCVDDDGADP